MSDDHDHDDDRPRCSAHTPRGRCRKPAIDGTTRCHHHSFKVPGRPTKLTPALTEQIVYLVLEGNYVETACQAVGISKATLYRWTRRADDAEAKALEHLDEDKRQTIYDHADPADWPYLDFRHAMKSAQAFAETELVRMARVGGPGWQAQMTLLERTRPARFGRRDTTKIEGELGVPTQAQTVRPETEEDRRRIAAALIATGVLDTEVRDAQAKPATKPRRRRATPRKGPKR